MLSYVQGDARTAPWHALWELEDGDGSLVPCGCIEVERVERDGGTQYVLRQVSYGDTVDDRLRDLDTLYHWLETHPYVPTVGLWAHSLDTEMGDDETLAELRLVAEELSSVDFFLYFYV